MAVVKSFKKYVYSSVTGLQSPTLLKIKTPSRGLHCVKSAEIWAFFYLYFPVYGQNRISIFPYLVRFSDSVQIRMDMILSIYGKTRTRESPYFGIIYALLFCGELL